MTEACSQIATGGWPLPGVELRIANDGEVLVRGPTVAAGALAADGWLHTGDLGALDGNGRLSITGRKADTIVTGGENVAPAEVEAILLEHPAVADAAVHGRPDPEWGEAIVATVVLRTGAAASGEDLSAHCASRLARCPKSIAFADALPRTVSGKLLRREWLTLRSGVGARRAGAGHREHGGAGAGARQSEPSRARAPAHRLAVSRHRHLHPP